MNLNEFLEAVLLHKRNAEAHGMRLDLMVLHRDFYPTLMAALSQSKKASDAFELKDCRKEPERKDIYLHGVKVMWSGNRLPARQVWYRYSNPNFKQRAQA